MHFALAIIILIVMKLGMLSGKGKIVMMSVAVTDKHPRQVALIAIPVTLMIVAGLIP